MDYFLILGAVLFAYMTFWFIVSLIKKRNDVADVAWGLGFTLLAWLSFLLSDEQSLRGVLVSSLVTIWGVRLAWHIHIRNRGKAEDYRYKQWREEWGKWFFLRSYGQVYLLQGFLLFLIILPVLFINKSAGSALGIFDYVGLAIWVIGFYFESVGDSQLAKFMKDPLNKGKLMTSGLWKYTRHPNYFGEVTQWWGMWIIALSVPSGFIAIIGPLTITVLILKISGIPMLEKRMQLNPDFEAYKRRTSVFFPLPPKTEI
jgi:steroid 5-alpha reductase family enzyme